MSAAAVSVRTWGNGFPRPGDDLVIACMACWPHSDGLEPTFLRPTWKAAERAAAEAAADRHNAARHPKEAAA
ncbi:hypothetical protein AXK57_20765 [Tsukamurella pulmonis]|uniref:hypothetical protein n=1 Tax=Tsukamurella pulmonis TaxID=47312 RepID=UPI000796BB05|nr:hypothetical protein [Tsukamurella pulmonis]KXP11995.1 hypothetical protein AXK57_20765 [Tsukamurella pulmonis]